MTASQPVMLIAGIPEDHMFVHVCYVAGYLSRMLPNFQFGKICKQREEWELWLKDFCKSHGWFHASSPLIWREIGTSPRNATYIGGATQFWEFIHEYYGVESHLTKHELLSLKQDFIQEFDAERRNNALEERHGKLNVSILGGDESLCEKLLSELLFSQNLHSANGIKIKLCNPSLRDAPVSEDIQDAAEIVPSVAAALSNCDVLVVLDEILRQAPAEKWVFIYSVIFMPCRDHQEGTDHWLSRCRAATLELAAEINSFSPIDMKVMFCSDGPTCFNAGVLAAAATKLDTNNIVVVSAYRGLEVLHDVSNLIGKEIGCPPVWGFLGVNHFVDVSNSVQTHDVYRPNDRALNPPKGTTLSLGKKQTELRSILYTTYDMKPDYGKSKVDESLKCRAVCDLLSLWYTESSKMDGEIISLGICSDGTFGIPDGIFFSQPVYLRDQEDKSRMWRPCPEFPVPNRDISIFNNLIETARILVDRLVCPRRPSAVSLQEQITPAY